MENNTKKENSKVLTDKNIKNVITLKKIALESKNDRINKLKITY